MWDGNTLIPLYDNEDSVCGMIYNEVPYYFLKNLQGDVIAITDHAGDQVAKYSYDAWGVCTVEQDAGGIADINPFRYRGYYFDRETQLYYLQSRYYDPRLGRFVNGDSSDCLGIRGTISYNLFPYCENDPVNNKDFCGFASINLSSIKSNVFAKWAARIKKLWNDGYEKKFINVSSGSFTLYLSMSVATTLAKLKSVSLSKSSVTISGKGFSTTLGSKKLTYAVPNTIGGIEIKTSAFVGTRGYGVGLSFIGPIYNIKNKKIGYISLNLVGEVTYLTLAAVALTVAGVCVVLPAVTPIAKQLVKTFSVLSSPSKVASFAYTFYTLATRLSNCFA